MSLARLAALLVISSATLQAQAPAYLGFDRNEYPGNANLSSLRQTFAYTGYWLNNPPGTSRNSWTGHRAAVQAAGFGFLILFNGRLYAELKSVPHATHLGQLDGRAAASSAVREGFPRHAIIFLDQEQGGRMLPEQKAYIYAWVDTVTAAGFRAGIYCSAIPNPDDNNVITAEDIRSSAAGRQITFWAINDSCPPSPGCTTAHALDPAASGIRFAEVWQFAQSPRDTDDAARCTNYSRDENCYPPGTGAARGIMVDLDSATTPDPSHGRIR